jgi:hypothetical protein
VKPTMPIPEWELDRSRHSPIKPGEGIIPINRASPTEVLLSRTFRGVVNLSDLDYITKAVLQVNDENHELRECVRLLTDRVRRLEAIVGTD